MGGGAHRLSIAFAGDYFTGEQVSFSLCHMVSIGLAAWFVGLGAGLVLAALSATAWVGSYLLVGHAFAHLTILYWNIAVEAGIYLATAIAVAQVRGGVAREHALSAQVSRAYDVMSHEVESAGLLQRELLSQGAMDIPGYEVSVHYATSTRAGGDLYDFIPLEDGRVGIVIADASGHGVSAGVLMGMTLVLTRSASTAKAPEQVLRSVNAQLNGSLPPGSFVTASYLVLEPTGVRARWSRSPTDPPRRIARGGAAVDRRRRAARTCARVPRSVWHRDALPWRHTDPVHGRHHGSDEPVRRDVRRGTADRGSGEFSRRAEPRDGCRVGRRERPRGGG